MKPDQKYIELIAAYLAGQLSHVEKADVDQWVKSSKENEIFFSEASLVWKNSGLKLQLPKDETDVQWLELKSNLDKAKNEGKVISLFRPASLLKIAASILLISGLSYVFLRQPPSYVASKKVTPPVVVTISANDHVIAIYLPDSTRVWLNVHGTLSYSKDYGKLGRQTKLTGEGYFDVRHDEKNPFVVVTKNATIQDLGTAFNVKEDDAGVILTVSEGTVNLIPNSGKKNVVIKANEKVVCTQNGEIEKTINDNRQFASWRFMNNPTLEKEKAASASYLINKFKWRKNAINQSVIEGTLKNSAGFAVYKNIVLKISYIKPNGKVVTTEFKIQKPLKAGETIHYQKKLLDILTNTRSLEVQVKSAVPE